MGSPLVEGEQLRLAWARAVDGRARVQRAYALALTIVADVLEVRGVVGRTVESAPVRALDHRVGGKTAIFRQRGDATRVLLADHAEFPSLERLERMARTGPADPMAQAWLDVPEIQVEVQSWLEEIQSQK